MEGVDIIIPYHGQYKLVRDLIGGIILYTRNIPYNITVVDDASENKAFFSTLAQMNPVDGVRSEEHKGFAASVNLGIKSTKRPWIVIMHSDIIINEVGWLQNLYDSLINLNKTDKVGMVSARSDNPGKIDLLKSDKEKRKDIGDHKIDEPLPFFCCMIARKVFDKIGLLKEYPYAWYEDDEFFYRMKQNGYNQGVSGKTWVQHLGEETIREVCKKNPEVKSIMENNREKCLSDLKTLFNQP